MATHLGEIDGVNALVDRTVERFGGIDIVVNNAANALALPLGEFTSEAWDKSFGVNLRGPVFLVQAALPHLERSEHAAVVNVISAGAFLVVGQRGDVRRGQGGAHVLHPRRWARTSPTGASG